MPSVTKSVACNYLELVGPPSKNKSRKSIANFAKCQGLEA